MGQYRPEYEVGKIANDGSLKYADINRPPGSEEIAAAYQVARQAGLRRFDERWGCSHDSSGPLEAENAKETGSKRVLTAL
jgi:hypothetical protein